MSVNLKVREFLPDDAIIFDNVAYDNSIIGLTTDGAVVYSYEKMIEEYMEDNECSEEDALDWVEYNTIRSLSYCSLQPRPVIMHEIWSD